MFVGLNPRNECDERGAMDGSILKLMWLDVWIATVVPSLMESEKRGMHRQKLYAHTYGEGCA